MIIKDKVYLVYEEAQFTGRAFHSLISAKRCVSGLKHQWPERDYTIYNVREIWEVLEY